jgi:hypothetical protein
MWKRVTKMTQIKLFYKERKDKFGMVCTHCKRNIYVLHFACFVAPAKCKCGWKVPCPPYMRYSFVQRLKRGKSLYFDTKKNDYVRHKKPVKKDKVSIQGVSWSKRRRK